MKLIRNLFKLKPQTTMLLGAFFILSLSYLGLHWQAQGYEQKRYSLLRHKADELQRILQTSTQASLDLMQEVSLAEQVVSALEAKTSSQMGQIRFLLQAIQNKSSLPDVSLSVLDEQGETLWGTSSKTNIDPDLIRLGFYGEEHLLARSKGSFFYAHYLEGIAPIVKKGKVSGLIHMEMPLEQTFLTQLKEALGEEVFLYDDQLQNSSLFSKTDSDKRTQYLSLLRRDDIQSRIKTAYLELSASRIQKEQVSLTPYASLVVVPFRGLGKEVVSMLVVLIPEKEVFPYQLILKQTLFWSALAVAIWILLKILVFFAFQITTLSPRITIWIFVGVLGLCGIVWIGSTGLETYFSRNLKSQNKNIVDDVTQVYKEYNTYVLNSIGDDRERLKRDFIRLLQGAKVTKPSVYEFESIPLGLKKGAASRVTASHVPIRWLGTGIFSEKAEEPFTHETDIYKVPVGRFAQKMWLVYSSAWGYPNKFGSPYGTKIGSVKVVFENESSLTLDLENGINIHDRFLPLEPSRRGNQKSKKAFEFISEIDPLTRLQYVEELEFTIPPIYADSKIDYLLFEDMGTPDVPIFYAVTLGTKKVLAFPLQFTTIEEKENSIQLKEPLLSRLSKDSLVYYEEDRIVELNFQDPSRFTLVGTRAPEWVGQQVLRDGRSVYEETQYFGFLSIVTYWPIKEKAFEKPWGMIGMVTPAYALERLQQVTSLIYGALFVLLLILSVVALSNFIVSWKRLRFKLISYSFLVSCVPLLLVVSLLSFLMWQREEDSAQNRVAAALEQSRIFLNDVNKRVEDVALLLSDREELLHAIKTNNKEKGLQLLNEAKISGLADFPGGFIVANFSQGIEQTQQWSTFNYPTLPFGTKLLLEVEKSGIFVNQVASLILGGSQVSLTEGLQDGEQGKLTVLVGVPLDQVFLSEMKRRGGIDLAFYTADNLRMTTMKISDSNINQELNSLAKSQFSSLLKEGENQFDVVRLDSSGLESLWQRTVVGTMPLKDESNRLVGMVAAFSTPDKTLFSALTTQKAFVFTAFFILALAVLMSYIVSRSITHPLSVLAKGADRVAQGGLDSVIQVSARDEIGDLAQSFNLMTGSLKEHQDRLEQKISDLLTLQKLSSRVSSVLEKEELMHLIVKLFCDLASFDKGMMLVKEEESDHYIVESGFGIRKTEFEKEKFLPEETLAGIAVKEKSLIFIPNHLHDERISAQSVHRRVGEKPMMVLAIPLIVKGKELGAVVLEKFVEKEGNIRVDEVLLMTLANHAAIALENAHLYEMAVEDGLTKVFVNRYFQFRLTEEVAHAKRYKTELSLVLLDLDSFKPINDTYGHQVGDKILVTAAQMMKKTFRSTDVVCRYGGDEFAVILPKTNGDEAVLIAERLRKEIEKLDFQVDPNIILRVTISIGIAIWDPSMDKEAFIKASDTALYDAKARGRNRISRSQETA